MRVVTCQNGQLQIQSASAAAAASAAVGAHLSGALAAALGADGAGAGGDRDDAGVIDDAGAAGAPSLPRHRRAFATGLPAWDALAPRRAFARGAIHELLFDPAHGQPKFLTTVLAGAACDAGLPVESEERTLRLPLPAGEDWGEGAFDAGVAPASTSPRIWREWRISVAEGPLTPALSQREREPHLRDPRRSVPPIANRKSQIGNPSTLVWSDPHCHLYPPALAELGIDLERLIVLRPRSVEDEVWAVAECLRCRGVGAVVAGLERLTRVQARRLQLAAERGGGVGLFLRPVAGARQRRSSSVYAAATRWRVGPARGERAVQRWSVQLVHGHGGRVGDPVIVEHHRDTHLVRATDPLADRSPVPQPAVRARA